jgi:hypothetical protein
MAKILPVAGGGSPAPNRFAFFQSASNITGEYHNPPSAKADTAAVKIAHGFRV